MDRESAEKLSILMMQINAQMDQAVAFVQDHDSKELFPDFHKTAGKIMGSLFFDIEKVLWEQYPELKPEQMDGPYEVPLQIFEPKFYIREY